MQALTRLRLLLPAIAIPACLAAAGFALDATAFDRPSASELLATRALRQLAEYRVMRGQASLDGRSFRTICVQGWFPEGDRVARGALVLLGDGTRLYDFGGGIRRYGGALATRTERRAFLLAGCPHVLDARFGSQLLRGAAEVAPTRADGTAAYAVRIGRPTSLALLVTRPSLRPLALRLPGTGWSDLEPGAGARTIADVRRSFRIGAAERTRHA